jgi:hypothetical protein
MSPKVILTGVDLEAYSVDCANYRSTDSMSDNGHFLGYCRHRLEESIFIVKHATMYVFSGSFHCLSGTFSVHIAVEMILGKISLGRTHVS